MGESPARAIPLSLTLTLRNSETSFQQRKVSAAMAQKTPTGA